MKFPALYYYVPPCPVCGSGRTGRYVKKPFTEADTRYLIEQSLKNGELVRLCDSVPIENAYCEECGYEWPEHIYADLWDTERIRQQKKIRGTTAEFAKFQNENPKKKKGLIRNIFGLLN